MSANRIDFSCLWLVTKSSFISNLTTSSFLSLIFLLAYVAITLEEGNVLEI